MIGFPKPAKRLSLKEWEKIRPKLYSEFYDLGIWNCEIRLEGCAVYLNVNFCHSKKRRDIKTIRDLIMVIKGCQPCHHKIEYFCMKYTGMTMTEYIEKKIEKRGLIVPAGVNI